jgi:hypothetical protein
MQRRFIIVTIFVKRIEQLCVVVVGVAMRGEPKNGLLEVIEGFVAIQLDSVLHSFQQGTRAGNVEGQCADTTLLRGSCSEAVVF